VPNQSKEQRIEFPRLVEALSLASRSGVLSKPSLVPAAPGIYAWYFAQVPGEIDHDGCHEVDGLTLLYVGISPKEPPTNGRAPSSSNLRRRLITHYAGNAAGSTLRLTLGCLLSRELGVSLRRVGSGNRRTLTNPGERILDKWMEKNAFVCWLPMAQPWTLERAILASGIILPLNIQGNSNAAHTEALKRIRSEAATIANALPIIADSGGPRKASEL
jgi:hypothetical protein